MENGVEVPMLVCIILIDLGSLLLPTALIGDQPHFLENDFACPAKTVISTNAIWPILEAY